MKTYKLKFDASTGETTKEEYDFVPDDAPLSLDGRLDIKKLKEVLLAKGIIKSASEIE